MIPVTQRYVGTVDPTTPEKTGDCYAACLASILELPIERVPHLMWRHEWWTETQAALRVMGFDLWTFEGAALFDYPGWWIASVPSLNLQEEGRVVKHAVVMHGSTVMWDPTPRVKREFLLERDCFASELLVALHPERAVGSA